MKHVAVRTYYVEYHLLNFEYTRRCFVVLSTLKVEIIVKHVYCWNGEFDQTGEVGFSWKYYLRTWFASNIFLVLSMISWLASQLSMMRLLDGLVSRHITLIRCWLYCLVLNSVDSLLYFLSSSIVLREIQEEELQKFYGRISKLLHIKDYGNETVDSLQRLHLIVSATKYGRT